MNESYTGRIVLHDTTNTDMIQIGQQILKQNKQINKTNGVIGIPAFMSTIK